MVYSENILLCIAIPLLISLLIALMLITFIPDITYVLPELLGMKVR